MSARSDPAFFSSTIDHREAVEVEHDVEAALDVGRPDRDLVDRQELVVLDLVADEPDRRVLLDAVGVDVGHAAVAVHEDLVEAEVLRDRVLRLRRHDLGQRLHQVLARHERVELAASPRAGGRAARDRPRRSGRRRCPARSPGRAAAPRSARPGTPARWPPSRLRWPSVLLRVDEPVALPAAAQNADSRPATSASPRRGSLPRWALLARIDDITKSVGLIQRHATTIGWPVRGTACRALAPAHPGPLGARRPPYRVPMMPQPDDADGHPPTAAPPSACPLFRPTAWVLPTEVVYRLPRSPGRRQPAAERPAIRAAS